MQENWLNSESRVPKVVWTWFKVHSMRNIWLSFRNNKMKFKISRSGCFWLFWLIFAKKWLNSEYRVPKVLWMWFKVHSMRNIGLSFRNNKIKFKISKSGCFWLTFAKNGWILKLAKNSQILILWILFCYFWKKVLCSASNGL